MITITYEQIKDLNDEELSELLSDSLNQNSTNDRYNSLLKIFPDIEIELKKKGVTLQLLWKEYREKETEGYGYSQFCFHYDQWKELHKVSMHLEQKFGDKMFVDFAGDKMKILNPISGLETVVEIFVSVLGGSGLTYVEAVNSQKKEDFILASENSLRYFGGVPRAIVPDCLKSAVTKGDKYEPEINQEYNDFARHYDTVILPARPYKPKDKSPVEIGVRLTYQRIFAPLRNKNFTSLKELNEAILVELDNHNNRSKQVERISRREIFERYERNLLKSLPAQRYEFKRFKIATVQINYHVYLSDDRNYYSVPYRLKGNKINIIYTSHTVEIFHKNVRVAIHERIRTPGRYSTIKEHMPSHHKFYAEWNPEKILSWSQSIGENVILISSHIMNNCAHPEQGFKSCIGIINLAKKYGSLRVDGACRIALSNKEYTYRFIQTILEKGMDKIEEDEVDLPFEFPEHENIRGNEYYKN
jgi:transposase